MVLGRNITNHGFLASSPAGGHAGGAAGEIRQVSSSPSVASALGVLTEKIWASKPGASVLVVQAGRR